MTILVDTPEIVIKRLVLGKWDTNAYVVTCAVTGETVLVDAPDNPAGIMAELKDTSLKYILMTHAHADHTGALPDLKRMGVPLAVHSSDAALLPCTADILLEDGDAISIGRLDFRVIHTPGHTSGSLCFLAKGHMLCGDTIFPGGPGKTRSPDDFAAILTSIREKILNLPEETFLHPGHGESTTVKASRSEFSIFSAKEHQPSLCGDVLWLSS